MKLCSALTLVLIGTVPVGATAQQASSRTEDEIAIRQTVEAFIQTRENNDRDGLSALLTADVDQLVTTGRKRTGRDGVVNGSLSTTANTGGRRQITIETIRFLGPDIAIGDGPYKVVGIVDGPDRHYLTTMVFRRVGDSWKIAAIRNMQPRQ